MRTLLILIVSFTLVMTTNVFASGSGENKDNKTFVTIVTGTTGGTYYPVGIIFSTLWNEKLGAQGIKTSAQSSGGSVENLKMLQGQEAQIGIANSGATFDAQEGQNRFVGIQYENVRMLTSLWPEFIQFVVTLSSGINSISDIAGKRFSVGAIGSGTEAISLSILETLAGLKPGDGYDDEHLGFAEASAAMQNGQLDGANIAAGLPTAAVSELTASNTPVKILNFTRQDYNMLVKDNPQFGYFTIKAGTYPKINKDVNTIGVKAVLVTDARTSDDLVYKLIKTLYDNYDSIKKSHGALSYISKETALDDIPAITLHPGAIRYYEEIGIKIPDAMR